jgi:hypothetical protein
MALFMRLWRPLPVRLLPGGGPGLHYQRRSAVTDRYGAHPVGRLTLGRMYNVSSAFGTRLYADQELVTSGPFALVR